MYTCAFENKDGTKILLGRVEIPQKIAPTEIRSSTQRSLKFYEATEKKTSSGLINSLTDVAHGY